MTLRLPTLEDMPDLIRMFKQFHRESPYKHISFDEKKTRETVTDIINGDKESSIIIISCDETKITGAIIGLSVCPLFSLQKSAVEMVWWVHPDYRKSGHGNLLLSAYEDWAKRVGCKNVQMICLETEEKEMLEKFFAKNGYNKIETAFVKGVL